jgi:hypothetical protein
MPTAGPSNASTPSAADQSCPSASMTRLMRSIFVSFVSPGVLQSAATARVTIWAGVRGRRIDQSSCRGMMITSTGAGGVEGSLQAG